MGLCQNIIELRNCKKNHPFMLGGQNTLIRKLSIIIQKKYKNIVMLMSSVELALSVIILIYIDFSAPH